MGGSSVSCSQKFDDCTATLGQTDCLILSDLPGSVNSGNQQVNLYAHETDSNIICVCEDRDGVSESDYIYFDLTDSDASSADITPTSTMPWAEVSCNGGFPMDVNFRTTHANYYYLSGAIAFTDTCGNNLIAFGHKEATSTLTGTCELDESNDLEEQCGSSRVLLRSDLPGGWMSDGDSPVLYGNCDVATTVVICDENDGGNYQVKTYDSTDPDTGDVSTSPDPVYDDTQELYC